ncbi:MAG: pyridoxamine 5'-phosphate oxidase family protein [Atopobiaceae bacterium]|nr:pyridoxamine 5'-phosphate oxidase family protein [Atopobiaceae bacterium]
MFRKMRRHAQLLDHEECEQILMEQPRGVLSVLGDDEYPYGVPLDYVYENGVLLFHCASVGHKMDAILAHDKASFCVLDDGVRHEGEWWMCFRSVIAFGRVSLVENEDEKRRALWKLAAKYFPADYDTESDIARNLARVAIVRFEIEHMTGKAVREK